jgi:predicted hotdog family 3-hydroxylacyl-ACP dehydratase
MSHATLLPVPEQVLPHRGAALLLDRILSADDQQLVAMCSLGERHTPYDGTDGHLAAWVGPELMAQAVAAFAGCRRLRHERPAADIGLLLGVRDYVVHRDEFVAGDEIRVQVVCSSEDEAGRGVFDCRLSVGEQVAASGTLTVFQPENAGFIQLLVEPA